MSNVLCPAHPSQELRTITTDNCQPIVSNPDVFVPGYIEFVKNMHYTQRPFASVDQYVAWMNDDSTF